MKSYLEHLKDAKIMPSLIPGGCTGLIQPFDTAINKPFKEYLHEFTDQYVEKQEKKQPALTTEGWTLSDRDVGITLPIDRSPGHQLQVKGIPASDFVIGDGVRWSSSAC